MAECKINGFKITIGEEKALYMSTLSDLGGYMLKLDFPMGEYKLYPFMHGYYLGVKDYLPKIVDAIQVFSNRDYHKGFSGTYHDGETDNVHRVRIFNHYIGKYMTYDWWYEQYFYEFGINLDMGYSETESEMDESETDESETGEHETDEYETDDSITEYKRSKVKILKDGNNIPVFFYLTKKINIDDLNNIKLECVTEIKDCGNIDVCWYVLHSSLGRIGIAVKQKKFYCMMNFQPGLCLFSSNGCRAIGTFYYDDLPDEDNLDEEVFESYHTYECEFEPCFCDYEYEEAKKKRRHLEYLISIGTLGQHHHPYKNKRLKIETTKE